MHVSLEVFQLFLVRNAEMLFLINNQQPEVGKFDVVGQKRMSADHNVDRAVLQAFLNFSRLRRRLQPRKHAHVERKTGHPLFEIIIVLPRQQSRRHDQRHLRACHRHGERCPQRNFGFAEADVAADQPIHRNTGCQIAQHVTDRIQLIFGFIIRKTGAKLVIKPFRRNIGFRFFQLTLRGDGNQLFGNFVNPFFDFCLFCLPGRAAERIQLNIVVVYPVTGNGFNVFHRHEQLVVVGINDFQTVMRRTAGRDVLKPHETADTVFDMHHQLADVERGNVGDKVF